MSKYEKLIAFLIACIIAVIAIGYHDQKIKCTARNGVLVRTLTGTACVQGIPE